MVTTTEWLNATRATGVIAYGTALTCCSLSWSKAKAGSALSRLAAFLTVAEAALLLDMLLNGRWLLHQLLMDEAMRLHAYSSRRRPQQVVLALLAGSLAAGVFLLWRRFERSAGSSLALLGLLLSLILWWSEVISPHVVDSILQHPIGPWMAVSFLWSLGSIMTALGILMEWSHARPPT